MDKFEEIGRRLDEELTRLLHYVEEEVAPGTERRMASFLRTVSAKLTEAALKLEARMAARLYSFTSLRILSPTTKAGALQPSHTTR